MHILTGERMKTISLITSGVTWPYDTNTAFNATHCDKNRLWVQRSYFFSLFRFWRTLKEMPTSTTLPAT